MKKRGLCLALFALLRSLSGCAGVDCACSYGVAESPVVPTTRMVGAPWAVILIWGADSAVHSWQV